MWRPAKVVPEHKKRATVVWGALLLGIVAYTAWQIVALRRKFDNPNTTLSVKDDLYAFPPLEVCFWGGEGCDVKLDITKCVNSVRYTVFDTCHNNSWNLWVPSQYYNCVALDLSKMDLKGFEDGCNEEADKPFATVTMGWYASFDPLNEVNYRSSVGVYLGNGSTPAKLAVPYSRVVISTNTSSSGSTDVEVDMTIGKLTRNFISGDSIVSYPVLTLSQVEYDRQTSTDDTISYTTSDTDRSSSYQDTTIEPPVNSSYAYGYLELTIIQGAFSVTEISDINPLDIGNLLGNIGGFWELLLVAWGLCFIASSTQEPTHKGRDFTQPIQRGREIVGVTRRSNSKRIGSNARGGDDREPGRSQSERGVQEHPGASIGFAPPAGDHLPGIVAAPSFRGPAPQDHSRRPSTGFIHPV